MTNEERWALLEELRALVARHHNGTETRDDTEALYTNVARFLLDVATHTPEPPARMLPAMVAQALPVIAESIDSVLPEGWHFALCVFAPEANGPIKCVTRGDGVRIHAALTKILAHVDVTRAPKTPQKVSN
jgi:hypothetical protein